MNYQNSSEYDIQEGDKKFDYLKGKYIMRFPFTLTAIKWGLSLGTFIGIHNYIKSRQIQNAIFWFFNGSIMTGMPIWGFFMFKYSFYSYTLRKFEQEQQIQIEQANFLKSYLIQQLKIQDTNIDEEKLVQKYQQNYQSIYNKHSKLDFLIQDHYLDQLEKQIFANFGKQ